MYKGNQQSLELQISVPLSLYNMQCARGGRGQEGGSSVGVSLEQKRLPAAHSPSASPLTDWATPNIFHSSNGRLSIMYASKAARLACSREQNSYLRRSPLSLSLSYVYEIYPLCHSYDFPTPSPPYSAFMHYTIVFMTFGTLTLHLHSINFTTIYTLV